MNPAFDAFLRSWPFNPLLVLSLALSAAIYFRGWRSFVAVLPAGGTVGIWQPSWVE